MEQVVGWREQRPQGEAGSAPAWHTPCLALSLTCPAPGPAAVPFLNTWPHSGKEPSRWDTGWHFPDEHFAAFQLRKPRDRQGHGLRNRHYRKIHFSWSPPMPWLAPEGHREIQVLDTDYESYAILRVSLMWRGRNFHVLKYFTRSLEDEERLEFWRFRELTADTGLYLVARPGEPRGLGVNARLALWVGSAAPHAGLSHRAVCQAPEGGEPAPTPACAEVPGTLAQYPSRGSTSWPWVGPHSPLSVIRTPSTTVGSSSYGSWADGCQVWGDFPAPGLASGGVFSMATGQTARLPHKAVPSWPSRVPVRLPPSVEQRQKQRSWWEEQKQGPQTHGGYTPSAGVLL
ncbi:hypothetical protein P7K49_002114 [Saguinus oedipus]|uniref:Uncharacterized protein n=1 Tax=Saguinus oedipus TaxID=9490 RepID=A0ABQ9WJ14_SAGOE|nr:hypothetical protein P7K49_002114 [Saguinus oedipus]